MSYKDTLKLYDDLIASGASESQARAQANQLGGITEYIEGSIKEQRNYFEESIREQRDYFEESLKEQRESLNGLNVTMVKIEKDLLWMRIIGATMIIAFMSNILTLWIKL